jgi:hypothetical protein
MTPSASAAVAGARAAERAVPRPGVRAPRRISGPARRPKAAQPPRRAVTRAGSPLLSLLAAAERLSSHRLLDRLIRGRAWLVLVTFALIGIVTLQLALLKLNGGVGRTLQAQALLQRENASLSIENSELAAADRVQTRAAQMGMEFASSSALRALTADPPHDYSRAASVLSAPVRSQTPGSEEGAGAARSQTGGEGLRESEASTPQSGEAARSQTSSGEATGEASSQAASGAASSSPQGAGEGSGGGQGAAASEGQGAAASSGGQGAGESSSGG